MNIGLCVIRKNNVIMNIWNGLQYCRLNIALKFTSVYEMLFWRDADLYFYEVEILLHALYKNEVSLPLQVILFCLPCSLHGRFMRAARWAEAMCRTNTEGTKEAFQALRKRLRCRAVVARSHSANTTFTLCVCMCERGWFECIWKGFYENMIVWRCYTESQRPQVQIKQKQIHLIFTGLSPLRQLAEQILYETLISPWMKPWPVASLLPVSV